MRNPEFSVMGATLSNHSRQSRGCFGFWQFFERAILHSLYHRPAVAEQQKGHLVLGRTKPQIYL